MAMSSRRWRRNKCLTSDFDKATFGRTANANSNGGSVNVSMASVLAAAEDKQRGSIDDPLGQFRKVVTNRLTWLSLDDWLKDDVAIKVCNISSGSAVEVYERFDIFRLVAQCVSDLVARVTFVRAIRLICIIIGIEGSLSPWARCWLNDVE